MLGSGPLGCLFREKIIIHFFITAFRSRRFFPNLNTSKAVFIYMGQDSLAGSQRYGREIFLPAKSALSALPRAMRPAKDVREPRG